MSDEFMPFLPKCHWCGKLRPDDKWIPHHPIQNAAGELFIKDVMCCAVCKELCDIEDDRNDREDNLNRLAAAVQCE